MTEPRLVAGVGSALAPLPCGVLVVRCGVGFPVGDGEAAVDGPGPAEGDAAVDPGVDEGADRVGASTDRGDRGAADVLSGDDGEERLDQVHPGRVGRADVRVDPRKLGEPGLHIRVVVGRVVVDHDVQLPARIRLDDHLEELDELDATALRCGAVSGRTARLRGYAPIDRSPEPRPSLAGRVVR